MARRAGTALALVLAVLLGVGLLWPDGAVVNRAVVRVYVVLHRAGVPDGVGPPAYAAVLNVLAFVPLAWLGVVALGWRVRTVVGLLSAASVTVELLQLLPVLDREPSLLDVACNSAGALVGALVGSRVAREHPRVEELVEERRDVGGDGPG